MPNIDYQKVRNDFARIQALADEIAKVLDKAGLAQRQGSYLDSRCKEIADLCQKISKEVGAGSGS